MLIRSDTAVEEPLSEHRLADGSARFLLPQQWEVKDFGTCSFVATAPSEASCFIVGKVQFLTPALGVRAPGVPVSEYLPPHKALQLVATQGGLARDVRFLEVIPRTNINQQIGAVFTAGTVQAEEFVYTATSPAGVDEGLHVQHLLPFAMGPRMAALAHDRQRPGRTVRRPRRCWPA